VSDIRVPNCIVNILKIFFARIGYWRDLGSSRYFTNHTLESCVNVIHEDIITVWNFDDVEGVGHSFIFSVLFSEGNQYLFGREFTATMTHLVEDTARMPEVSYVDNHADRSIHLVEDTARMPEVSYVDNHADRIIHLVENTAGIPEVSYVDNHADRSIHLEEIHMDGPNLALDDTSTDAASRTPLEKGDPKSPNLRNINWFKKKKKKSPNLALLDETFTDAASRTPVEVTVEGPNIPHLNLDVTITPMAPWMDGSYQNK
jgi:hypothetical protein